MAPGLLACFVYLLRRSQRRRASLRRANHRGCQRGGKLLVLSSSQSKMAPRESLSFAHAAAHHFTSACRGRRAAKMAIACDRTDKLSSAHAY